VRLGRTPSNFHSSQKFTATVNISPSHFWQTDCGIPNFSDSAKTRIREACLRSSHARVQVVRKMVQELAHRVDAFHAGRTARHDDSSATLAH
jgi:hypothetical protein